MRRAARYRPWLEKEGAKPRSWTLQRWPLLDLPEEPSVDWRDRFMESIEAYEGRGKRRLQDTGRSHQDANVTLVSPEWAYQSDEQWFSGDAWEAERERILVRIDAMVADERERQAALRGSPALEPATATPVPDPTGPADVQREPLEHSRLLRGATFDEFVFQLSLVWRPGRPSVGAEAFAHQLAKAYDEEAWAEEGGFSRSSLNRALEEWRLTWTEFRKEAEDRIRAGRVGPRG